MLHTRNHLCGAALNDRVFVGGGTNDSNSYLSSMEMLDTDTNRWLEVAGLVTPRRSCAATISANQIGQYSSFHTVFKYQTHLTFCFVLKSQF